MGSNSEGDEKANESPREAEGEFIFKENRERFYISHGAFQPRGGMKVPMLTLQMERRLQSVADKWALMVGKCCRF